MATSPLEERWDKKFGRVLIAGNPTLPAEWGNLPGAEKELAAVACAVGFKADTKGYWSGGDATKERVVDKAVDLGRNNEVIDLLCFATHGVANGDEPMAGGFLVLAGKGDPKRSGRPKRFSPMACPLSWWC
jgi:hypothetical protein